MKSQGTINELKRQRIKFRCPIKASKKISQEHGDICPVNDPRFNTGKCYGCTKYLDITDDARSRIPRDCEKFKETSKIRENIEQYFARLGDRKAEQTAHQKSDGNCSPFTYRYSRCRWSSAKTA